jgi:hypothetical protein
VTGSINRISPCRAANRLRSVRVAPRGQAQWLTVPRPLASVGATKRSATAPATTE